MKKRYVFPNIKKAVFEGGDDLLTAGDPTVFVKVLEKGKYLYRQLTFGDIKIYDPLFLVDEDPERVSKNLIILFKDKKYKIETNEELFSLVEKLKLDIVGKLKNTSRQEIIKQLNKDL